MFTGVERALLMPPVVTDTSAWLKQAFPLPTVVALIVYTMGASSFISTWKAEMEARVTVLEKVTQTLSSHENRLTILEQQFIRIQEGLIEIKELVKEAKRQDRDGKQP